MTIVDDLSALPVSAQLVVEAAPERPDLKIDVLTRAEKVLGEQAVLASNTSSLSIAELGAALPFSLSTSGITTVDGRTGRASFVHHSRPTPWLRRAGAIDECLEVCEDVLSGYDELDLDNQWTRAVVIDYAHVLGETGDIAKANEYVDLVTAETDGLVDDYDLEPVVELRLARIEWERRGGDLEQAARLAADLVGHLRARKGFSGNLTWRAEKVYTKLIKKVGLRPGLRFRLRAARTTAGTILKDNW
ncbi:3-hydroxyacyl-CoA dehydrogenase NAD-binding domain-containing protein [Amycolatopsis sp. NPDC058340]|uniref:3-hydroxyacyl-CoA dehydrogenase NAD-binding domain-containing protein n=1 Tax=Amycolatopsis sp. NPDC058340 TaxID=3346453 RepID=UPI00364FC25E